MRHLERRGAGRLKVGRPAFERVLDLVAELLEPLLDVVGRERGIERTPFHGPVAYAAGVSK